MSHRRTQSRDTQRIRSRGHSPRHHLRTHNPRQHGAAFPRRRLRRRYAFSGCPHRLPAHTPGAVAELKSKYENDEKQENYNAFYGYLALAGSAAAILLLYVLFLAFTPSIKSRFDRYNRLNKIKLLCICATFFTLGMALPALIVLLTAMHYCRNKRRICPNCHSKMHKLPEDEDNKYLTPAQDLEEQLESIDYDVWLCDTCGEVDVYHSPTSAPYTANVSNATPAHRILKATAFSHSQTPPAAATACAHTFAATAERNRKSTTKSPRLLHLW